MSDAAGLEVGATAPDFTATLVEPDGTRRDASLSELVAEKPVLLTFYTVDFSPDCIEEWCSFRDFDWFSANENVQVVGVSKSRPYLHEKFLSYLDLNFPLFSDPDLDAADKFNVSYKAFHLFSRSRRSCFLVDEDMTVRYKWVGEHWLDPTRDVPPVGEIHEALMDILDESDTTDDFEGAFA